MVAVIEVKCRAGVGFGDPLEAITYAKVQRLRVLVAEWVSSLEHPVGRIRLDAIGVLVHADGTASITHVKGIES